MLTVPVILCFNIIDWNLIEVKRLDIKVRKIMTTYSIMTQRPIFTVFTSHEVTGGGERDLTELDLYCKTSTIGLFRYLNLSDD